MLSIDHSLKRQQLWRCLERNQKVDMFFLHRTQANRRCWRSVCSPCHCPAKMILLAMRSRSLVLLPRCRFKVLEQTITWEILRLREVPEHDHGRAI
jgi:hypothetical protein